MKLFRPVRRLAVYTSIALLLTSCAAPPSRNDSANANSTGSDPCDVTKSALAGAVAGALLGALLAGKSGAAKGGLAGGALGAATCYTMNVQSQQTKTAAQADMDYKRAHGALQSQPTVVTYAPKVASNSIQRGNKLTVNSTLELANGSAEPIREVQEELQISNPDGTPFKTGSKPFNAKSSGRFENSFDVTLPPNSPQGIYALKANVYINGKQSASRDLRTQLVWDGTTAVLVATR